MEARSADAKRVELGDGRVALIAPINPSDRARFLEGMGRASAESFYKRFITPIARLTNRQIGYLIGVDHRDHEALLAVDEDSGEAVAVGRFVRDAERPGCAEAAMLVIDDWHGLGLGKALSRALSDRARELGIERFEATMLTDNAPMLAVLRSLGEVRTQKVDGSTLSVEVDLPEPEPAAERITGTMRIAGDERYELEE